MLTLNEAQLQAFAPELRRQFEEESVAMLRAAYPDVTKTRSREQLLEFVRAGADRAGLYGIAAYPLVRRWLHLMVQWGPRFDEDTPSMAVASVLRDPGVAEDAKVTAVEQAVVAEVQKQK
jgi:hypothetical protein